MGRAISTLKTPVRIFNTREYSSRLLFVNNQLNPRDVLGKFGITFHSSVTAIESKTIKINATVLEKNGKSHKQIIYLNRNSLRKYLHAQDNDFNVDHATDEALIAQLNHTTWDDSNRQEKHFAELQGKSGDEGLRHAGRYNRYKFNSTWNAFKDGFIGKFFSWLYQKTVNGLNWFKLRFVFINKEKDYFHISEVLAARRFKEAKKNVPAYKEHLASNQFNLDSDTDLTHIPVTTKDNYIKKHAKKFWDTHVNGRLPEKFKVDTSTGTTENPTVWVRSNQEVQTVKHSLATVSELVMNRHTPFIINTFALGPWATGLSIHEISREIGSTYSVGADPDKILEMIELQYQYEQSRLNSEVDLFIKSLGGSLSERNLQQELQDLVNRVISSVQRDSSMSLKTAISTEINTRQSPHLKPYIARLSKLISQLNDEKKQLLITGYPPFLLSLVSYARRKGIDFTKYNAIGGAGGQAIGEPMRRAMEENGFMRVVSSYGASDLDINLGMETEAEIEIRRALEKNPGMARELFGANKGVPMIFRFDPLNYLIECDDKENHLIYTCNRDNRSSPRIRYDLKDTGRVYASSDVQAMLTKYGIFNPKISTKLNLPYLFIWGRDSTAGFGTCNIPFDELESAIQQLPDDKDKILKRSFYSYQEQHQSRFDIWLELNDGVEFLDDHERDVFHAKLIKNMSEKNEYFQEEINRLGDEDYIPSIQFFTRGHSPIAEPGGVRKQVLVFQQNINFDGAYAHGQETRQLSRLTKQNYLLLLQPQMSPDLNP